MQLVPVRQIHAGMRLARTIFLSGGRLFLIKGAELRESYIAPLLEQGIAGVYVINELAPDITANDVVSDEARKGLTDELRNVLGQIQPSIVQSAKRGLTRFQGTLEPARLKNAIDTVVGELISNPQVVYNLKDLRTADDYTLGHSVNVCILSTLLGSEAGLNAMELKDLALGALLHDVGKTAIPPQVLNKPGALNEEEMAVMQRHTVEGWNILKEQRGIPYTSAVVALQHHERWQGGGYPEGLTGEQIYRNARICAVADVYDAMTADRVYRAGHSSDWALQTMMNGMPTFFEPELVQAFCQCVAPYPVGSVITISGGRQAVVVEVPRGNTFRPKIRTLLEPDGTPVAQPVEIALTEHPEIQVTSLVSEATMDFSFSFLG